jgi:hypothetical protein
MNCLICTKEIYKKHFPQHLRKYHNIDQQEYTLQYIFNDVNPLCKCGCNQKTQYVKKEYRFNDYLHNHHKPTLGKEMSKKTKEKIAEKQSIYQQSLSKEQRANNTKISLDKARKVFIEKYGVDNPFKILKFEKSNNHNWKGGTGDIKKALFGDYSFYKLWKYPILLRDCFKCTKCNELKDLNVHHTQERMTDIYKLFLPEDRLELTYEEKKSIVAKIVQYHIEAKVSGITLCKSCHKQLHAIDL